MYNIAVIGPENTIGIFRAIGAQIFEAHTTAEAVSQIDHIRQQKTSNSRNAVALIVVLEELLESLHLEEINHLYQGNPVLIAIPGPQGSGNASIRRLRSLAEKAVGSDILG